MGFTVRKYGEILEELQSWTSATASMTEGTFTNDVLSANALEFSKVELEILAAYMNSFLDICENEYLDLRAHEVGCYRREGKKAVGKLTVTGNGVVRAGALFQTEAGTRFVAVSETVVVGSAEIEIEAQSAGAAGNVEAGTIVKIPLNIPGIRGCENAAATYDGYDEESDDELRERALLRIRYPTASGNPYSYVNWATSVTGCAAVRVQRCWAGAGTVKVVVIDSNFEPANADLLARVSAKIEEERPIGAEVTVVSAVPRAIDISAAVRGTVDLEAFEAAVRSYFINMTNQTLTTYEDSGALDYVSLAQVGSFIINAGADDYSDLRLNGGTENVALGFDDIPALGKVEFG